MDSRRERTTCEHCGLVTSIKDRCPSCGGQTLFVGASGLLTCSLIGCKDPGVSSAISALRYEHDARLANIKGLLNAALIEVLLSNHDAVQTLLVAALKATRKED